MSKELRSAAIRLGILAYLNKGDIYVRELPDGAVRRLTFDGKNTSPRWSPNGQWLSFFADSQLCVVNRDGTKRRTFPLASNWQQNYDWLPGSESLLLVQDAGETIVRADVNSGNMQPLVRCSTDYERLEGVSISPDGKRFVYVVEQHATESNPRRPYYRRLWTATIDGRNRRRLFTSRQHEHVPELGQWTPDSRYHLFWALAFYPGASVNMDGIHYYSAAVDGSVCREISRSVAVESVLEKREQIAIRQGSPCLAIGAGGSRFLVENKWIVLHDPATGRNRRLTVNKVAASHPAWSRDGKRLAYVSCPLPILKRGQEDREFGARWTRLRLHVMDAEGKNVRRLTEGETYRDATPRYLADNRHILFARLHRDHRQFGLWIVREDGQNLRQVVSAIGSPENGPYADGCFDVWFRA